MVHGAISGLVVLMLALRTSLGLLADDNYELLVFGFLGEPTSALAQVRDALRVFLGATAGL